MAKTNSLRITLVKSPIGTPNKHRQTLVGLGLKKIRQVVERENSPAIRGMVAKVHYLVAVEEI